MNRLRSIRSRLTYANVASSLALFIALGGTSYALTLPRNSVGSEQLREDSVRSSELRNGAVRSVEIRNKGVALRDLSLRARSALRGSSGRPGPAGTPAIRYFLEVNSIGGHAIGNGLVVANDGPAGFVVRFPGSVAACALTAAPAQVPGGAVDAPPGATVIASHDGDNALVRTYNAAGNPQALPFALIAAC